MPPIIARTAPAQVPVSGRVTGWNRKLVPRSWLWLLVGVLLFWLPAAFADQNDARLPSLFSDLRSATSLQSAQQIELTIWRIWIDSGRPEVDALMDQGTRAMLTGNFDFARRSFDQVIRLAPKFAEGWNKRATVHFLQDHLDESVHDIGETLLLEPRHFGAISGMGLILVQRGDLTGALRAFEAVLAIHPFSPSARASIQELRSRLGRRAL